MPSKGTTVILELTENNLILAEAAVELCSEVPVFSKSGKRHVVLITNALTFSTLLILVTISQIMTVNAISKTNCWYLTTLS